MHMCKNDLMLFLSLMTLYNVIWFNGANDMFLRNIQYDMNSIVVKVVTIKTTDCELLESLGKNILLCSCSLSVSIFVMFCSFSCFPLVADL